MQNEEIINKDPKFNASLAVLQSIHFHLENASMFFSNYDFERCYLQLKATFWFASPIIKPIKREELKSIFNNAEKERKTYLRWKINYSELPQNKRPDYNGNFHNYLEKVAELIPLALQDNDIYFSFRDKSDLLRPEEEW